MLRRTFLHLTGIGPVREGHLWHHGVLDWADLARDLRQGVPPAARIGRPGSTARRRARDPDPRVEPWLATLDASETAWERQDWGWFCRSLPLAEHWRILGPRLDAALYLDIETTGGAGPGSITVVGILYQGRFQAWVAPDDLREVADLVREAPLVVTFAGRGFDIPMLQRAVPGFPEPRAHVDLLPLARRARVRGGLKGVERHYGLARDDDVAGLRGHDAITLWNRWRRGDAAALDRLLRYNRADVEMMPLVGARLTRDLLAAAPGEHGMTPAALLRPAALEAWVVPCAPPAPRAGWLRTRAAAAQAAGRHLPVVVAVVGRGWARLAGTRLWTSQVPRPADAAAMTGAARPDRVVVGDDASARALANEGLRRRRRTVSGRDRAALARRVADAGLPASGTRSDDELAAVSLALDELRELLGVEEDGAP